jgi:GntR family transcriptional regulator
MSEPMYRQIADELRHQIETGVLEPGAQLPTEPELRKSHSASRNTVRDAIKGLVALGLVETRPGQGTFVVDKVIPFVTTLSTDPALGSSEGPVYYRGELVKPTASEPPEIKIERADAAVALQLGLDEGARVVSRHQERSIDGTAWSLQTSYYPMTLVQRGAVRLIEPNDITEGTVAYLKKALRIQQVGYRDTITVRAPESSEATYFGVAGDGRIPVLAASRTAFDKSGEPIRMTISVYAADRTLFAVNAGQVPVEARKHATEAADSEPEPSPENDVT